MDIATNGREDMIEYRHFAAHLEFFDVANLLDHAVVLLNLPVPVMQLLEIGLFKGIIISIGIRQEHDVVAQLVF